MINDDIFKMSTHSSRSSSDSDGDAPQNEDIIRLQKSQLVVIKLSNKS